MCLYIGGTDENQAPTNAADADQQNGTLDSSPLTRDRGKHTHTKEEEQALFQLLQGIDLVSTLFLSLSVSIF